MGHLGRKYTTSTRRMHCPQSFWYFQDLFLMSNPQYLRTSFRKQQSIRMAKYCSQLISRTIII